jgi:hypothetical protein
MATTYSPPAIGGRVPSAMRSLSATADRYGKDDKTQKVPNTKKPLKNKLERLFK